MRFRQVQRKAHSCIRPWQKQKFQGWVPWSEWHRTQCIDLSEAKQRITITFEELLYVHRKWLIKDTMMLNSSASYINLVKHIFRTNAKGKCSGPSVRRSWNRAYSHTQPANRIGSGCRVDWPGMDKSQLFSGFSNWRPPSRKPLSSRRRLDALSSEVRNRHHRPDRQAEQFARRLWKQNGIQPLPLDKKDVSHLHRVAKKDWSTWTRYRSQGNFFLDSQPKFAAIPNKQLKIGSKSIHEAIRLQIINNNLSILVLSNNLLAITTCFDGGRSQENLSYSRTFHRSCYIAVYIYLCFIQLQVAPSRRNEKRINLLYLFPFNKGSSYVRSNAWNLHQRT